MDALRTILHQVLDALLLRDTAYETANEASHPVRHGVAIIVTIGVIVALAGVVGAALTGWTTPDFDAIRETVWNSITQMTWVNDIPAKERGEVLTNMQQMYDAGWRVAALFIPSASKALAGVVLKPLGLLVAWLVYGVLAFVTARLLGGRGSLGVTYGATALAASPQLLSIFQVIPGVNLAGLGIWAVICNYLALKHTHDLSPGRTFWATVMPYLILILLVMLLASFVGVLTAMRFANGLPAIGGGA